MSAPTNHPGGRQRLSGWWQDGLRLEGETRRVGTGWKEGRRGFCQQGDTGNLPVGRYASRSQEVRKPGTIQLKLGWLHPSSISFFGAM